LLAIIDDILNISHIEAGQVLVNESSTNLNLILKNLYSQFHPEATRKGIAFTLNTPSLKQDQDIMTDEFKVIGIITNLLNNAFKFTHEGSVELGCTHGEDFSEIYVKDTGIGIPESEHERIFSRFYQIDKSPSRVYAGMGLGLAICKAYVDLLGGRITVDSSPGRGSTFSFTLPRKIAYPDIPVKEKDRADSRDVLAFGRTVLVAEDEDSAFAFIREVLNPLGIKTLRAFNGLEAIDVCRSNPDIELVLMDIRMPVKDGYESASEILKFRPQLPIIAQTAYGYPRDRKSATEKGCIDQLTKPFNKDQLISMITKHLK
jgi:CheY-like chemotaxis protein